MSMQTGKNNSLVLLQKIVAAGAGASIDIPNLGLLSDAYPSFMVRFNFTISGGNSFIGANFFSADNLTGAVGGNNYVTEYISSNPSAQALDSGSATTINLTGGQLQQTPVDYVSGELWIDNVVSAASGKNTPTQCYYRTAYTQTSNNKVFYSDGAARQGTTGWRSLQLVANQAANTLTGVAELYGVK